MSTPEIGLRQPATPTTSNESPMATDQFSRYEFADLERCMRTLISFLKSIHASYESHLEPRAYVLEITEIIKCIKKNEVYGRRGKSFNMEGRTDKASAGRPPTAGLALSWQSKCYRPHPQYYRSTIHLP